MRISFRNALQLLRICKLSKLLVYIFYSVVLEAAPYLISLEKGLGSLIKGFLELAKELSYLYSNKAMEPSESKASYF
ncbi:hypothetical protein WN944_015382 [Citrus x changshan-huyou]|uniref:Uncharacterized protein n=1 Tax=Citrus x changshan-huyou TaxID=2935761 RepID=A0AAP0MBR8_9ROSI